MAVNQHWLNADLHEWDEQAHTSGDTDKSRILGKKAVPCRICEVVFKRLRLTLRYCNSCGTAFCEGEHGSFAAGVGTCIRCGPGPLSRT